MLSVRARLQRSNDKSLRFEEGGGGGIDGAGTFIKVELATSTALCMVVDGAFPTFDPVIKPMPRTTGAR